MLCRAVTHWEHDQSLRALLLFLQELPEKLLIFDLLTLRHRLEGRAEHQLKKKASQSLSLSSLYNGFIIGCFPNLSSWRR